MTIKDELLALRNEGILIVDDVEAWARDHPDSALHASLEWDDAKAGKFFRFHQIRQLVRIHVIDDEGERTLISLSIDRVRGGGYRNLVDVQLDVELASVMLADALHELNRTKKKFAHIRELATVWRDVDQATRQHEERSERLTDDNHQGAA